jgi:acylphosphatase
LEKYIFNNLVVKSISIKVTGKVQGVFFRASTKEMADQLGVKGFVRNDSSGGVYIEAEANEETLKHFADWCKRGPSRAIVTATDVQEIPFRNFSNFEVRR